MAKYKPHGKEQSLMVPVRLEEQLQPGTIEHAIDHLIGKHVDLTIFEARYHNDEVGRPAWDPAVLLKVILFAYSRGILSSREIARACEENIVFVALSDNSRPHHTTVADFISSMRPQIESVFQQVLLLCSELDLIGGELLAIDGCKLSSNAAKEWSGTRAQLEKKKEKIQAVVANLAKKHRERDDEEEGPKGGPGEREERLEAKVRRIAEYLDQNGPKEGKRGKELQGNITDPESAKMVSSHGVVQGYNGLAVVDAKAQVIVHAEAFGSGQEHGLLEPMLDGASRNLAKIGRGPIGEGTRLAADTGYHTKANCRLLEERGIDGYVPDQKFRQRDARFDSAYTHKPVRERKYGLQDFRRDEARDRYICPGGKELRVEKHGSKKLDYIMKEYIARESDCASCALRANCLQSEKTKRRRLSIMLDRFDAEPVRRMRDKIDTPQGREIYSKRMGIVEPVFANIRHAKGMDRITLRGRIKATIQWMLYGIVHNLEKISHANYMNLAYG